MLNRVGVKKVVMMENGKLAMEAEAQQEFDVILLDVQMPVMDGIEAAKLILQRGDSDYGTMPLLPLIVFVTAHVSSSFELECIAAGASSYLAKPYTLPVLEQTLLETDAGIKETTTIEANRDVLKLPSLQDFEHTNVSATCSKTTTASGGDLYQAKRIYPLDELSDENFLLQQPYSIFFRFPCDGRGYEILVHKRSEFKMRTPSMGFRNTK